jgi:hypothetical protein
MRAFTSSQEEPTFWISVVLVQARFGCRFILFAKFPVIKPRFTIEFIQLRTNFPPLFRIELRQRFQDLGLDHDRNLPRSIRRSKQRLGKKLYPFHCTSIPIELEACTANEQF